MKTRILFVERKFNQYVSIEKAFREIAESLSDEFEWEFQQLPYGNSFLDTLKNLLFFRKKKADIYHITGHVHYIALLFSPKNTVLSIMDVRFLYMPEGLKRFILKKLYLDLPVKRLKYITAISEKTREEILLHSGCEENKVRTLELPLFKHIHKGTGKNFNKEKPTILQIGTMPNKNIPNLARALKGIKCKLKIIGRMNNELISVLEENQIDFENAFDLDDEQVRKEYEEADILTYCSLFEGFGLPIIEAQAMHKAVITSNLSPMKEASGDGAFLADPNDFLSIREGIQKIIDDDIYRKGLIEKGLENIKRYKPELVARQYEKLYKEILASGKKI
jgi:glycosyltransferase involved in cell wall biosynthesis